MWTDTLAPGNFRITGKKAELKLGRTVMYGSSQFLHKAMVPPTALDFTVGRSGSVRSSEFSQKQYSCWTPDVYWLTSVWYTWGSLRKTRSGRWVVRVSLRTNWWGLMFSMFHVNVVNVLGGGDASVEVTDLSEHWSLNDHWFPYWYHQRQTHQ